MTALLSLLVSAAPAPSAADVWLPSAVVSSIAVALVGGTFATIQALSTKKLRSPADRLAEVEFYVGLAKQQVAEAREDKKELEATLSVIRAYVETLEANGRTDAANAREQEQQLRDLRAQLDRVQRRADRKDRLAKALQDTIDAVAEKVVAGLPITLADLAPIGFRPEAFLDTGELAAIPA